jgi:vacuolar-type H+-ATPase subunit I/STV1
VLLSSFFFDGTVRFRKELADQIQSKLDDLKVVLSRTEEHRRQSLANLALHLSSWQQKVKKVHFLHSLTHSITRTLHILNFFNCLILVNDTDED